MRNSLRKQIVNFDLSSFENPLLNDRYSVYGEIQLDEFIINNSDGNKYILTHDLKVVETKFVVSNKRTGARYIFGSAFKKLIFFTFHSNVEVFAFILLPMICLHPNCFQIEFLFFFHVEINLMKAQSCYFRILLLCIKIKLSKEKHSRLCLLVISFVIHNLIQIFSLDRH